MDGLPADAYTHFDVHVPDIALGYAWEHWAHERGRVDVSVRRSVPADKVQAMLDWIVDYDPDDAQDEAVDRLLKRSGY